MEVDKALQIIALENRKTMLEGIKQQAKNKNISITANRGVYELSERVTMTIAYDIIEEIGIVNKQLEELTGLNEERMDYLNNIAEV